MTRILTSAILIPAVVAIVLYGPWWLFLVLTATVGCLAFHEYDSIVGGHRIQKSGWMGMAAGLIFLLAPEPILPVLAGLTLVLLGLGLRSRNLESMLAGTGAAVLGILYIFGAWRCAEMLRNANPHWVLVALLASWAGDTAALYIGRAYGRNKLAPRISPGKTVEGAMGSLAAGMLAGTAYAAFLLPGTSTVLAAIIAGVANAAGQVGDLCESALKRGAGVKDSGTTLPGHGGWLDRIDSTLFSIPAVYLLLRLLAI